jgi:hypothetical protein
MSTEPNLGPLRFPMVAAQRTRLLYAAYHRCRSW